MGKTGSLIELHSHGNIDVLNKLSESEDGKLLYDDESILEVSNEENNIIEQKEDGIYATISLATQQQIAAMIEKIWNRTNFISQDNMAILTADGQILKAKEE